MITTRIKSVTNRTQDVDNLDRKIRHFMKHKNVVIKKGLLKNFSGRIVGKPIPLYSKNDFYAKVKFKDLSKSIKSIIGTNILTYKGKELKPTARKYKRILPKWSSDYR